MMQIKPVADYDEHDPGFERESCPCKREVLAYLKSFEPKYRASKVFDPVVGRHVERDELAFTDGSWGWTTGDIYLFERYDLKLDSEFLKHAREQGLT